MEPGFYTPEKSFPHWTTQPARPAPLQWSRDFTPRKSSGGCRKVIGVMHVSFNGAGILHPGKGLSWLNSRLSKFTQSFNGAGILHPGKGLSALDGRRGFQRFNGAGILHPGKVRSPQGPRPLRVASMEPGFYTPEKLSSLASRRPSRRCFNGAGILHPGKGKSPSQWCCGKKSFNGAGILHPGKGRQAVPRGLRRLASMEPGF